jgi:quinol monooxygenase YgiN
MRTKVAVLLGLSLITFLVVRSGCSEQDDRIIRLAEIDIDPAQVRAYKAALAEEIEASIRIEPGVLTLYAVSVKGQPEQVRLFEIYRDAASYQAHLQSAHFKKYKQQTQQMVKSLKLVETETILLGSKLR